MDSPQEPRYPLPKPISAKDRLWPFLASLLGLMISMPILMGVIPIPDWVGRFSLAVILMVVVMWEVHRVHGRSTSGREVRRSITDNMPNGASHQEWSGAIPGMNLASLKTAADVFAQSPQFAVHGFDPNSLVLMLRRRLDGSSFGYAITVRCTPNADNARVTVTCAPYSSASLLTGVAAKENVARVVATLQALAALTQEPLPASSAGAVRP